MWQVDNGTKFATAGTGVLDKDGRKSWVVVVKGTFVLHPNGSIERAETQLPPSLVPEYFGEPGRSSLRYEADLLPAKTGTDVVLNASAHAPGGRPATKVQVTARLAGREKSLVVHGERLLERDLTGTLTSAPPRPFLRQPIRYEHSHGGHDERNPETARQRMDPANPVGCGLVRERGLPVPAVEHAGSGKGPAGFGSVASYWWPRSKYAGTYDGQWVQQRKPLLPADFDLRWHRFAPEDQQFEAPLRGGEAIDLVHLSPGGRLTFALPRHQFGFSTFFGRRRREHKAQLEAVVIEPDEARLIMVWKSELACHAMFDDLDFTRVVEKDYLEREGA